MADVAQTLREVVDLIAPLDERGGVDALEGFKFGVVAIGTCFVTIRASPDTANITLLNVFDYFCFFRAFARKSVQGFHIFFSEIV